MQIMVMVPGCRTEIAQGVIMLKILIAVDGSEHASRALEAVGQMAAASLALEAVLLCVDPGVLLDPLFSADYTMVTIQKLKEEQEKQQDATLADAIRQAKPLGVRVCETVRGYGSISKEILRIASEKKCDQIAMGTRGMGSVGNLMLGSVAQGVIHRSPIPVLLVK
jgi:nucleotide-binding universal stress UspA family protein